MHASHGRILPLLRPSIILPRLFFYLFSFSLLAQRAPFISAEMRQALHAHCAKHFNRDFFLLRCLGCLD